jgi:hypothetical protein
MATGSGKASPKKTPGEELCGKVARVAKILGVRPEEIGLFKGPRGTYLEPSVDMASILRGIRMTVRAVYVREMPEKEVSELSRLVGELI